MFYTYGVALCNISLTDIEKDNIQEAIQAEIANISEKVEVTAEDVVRMLKAEAEGTKIVPGATMSQSARVTAISLLGKIHGMFIDNTNVNVTDLDARMQRAQERLEARQAAQREIIEDSKKPLKLVSGD